MRCCNGIDVILLVHGRDPTVSESMTKQSKHDQMADKIANVDLNKEPANDHEKRLQDLKRFLLKADWLDDN